MMTRFSYVLVILATVFSCTGVNAQGTYAEILKAVERGDTETTQRLLERGAPPDAVDDTGTTLLGLADRGGDLDMVNLLLAKGAKVDAANVNGDTPILWASLYGHGEIVKRLYAKGARLDRPGWNPLHYAAFGGHLDVMEVLLDLGVDANVRSANQSTPLIMAVRNRKPEAVRLLLDKGANPNLANDRGTTPLGYALDQGYREIGEMLIARGADR